MDKNFYCSRCGTSAETKDCPQCGRRAKQLYLCSQCNIWVKSKECPECGQWVGPWIHCFKCDISVSANLKECPQCGRPIGSGSLARRFGAPPFSVLDPMADYWKEGRNKWAERGIQGDAANDPYLCELMCRWFAPAGNRGGHILDPFAGDATNGLVAAYLGFDFTGLVSRPEQVKVNEARLEAVREGVKPQRKISAKWICGDLPAKDAYDFIFTTPSFYGLYSPEDSLFTKWYLSCWQQAIAHLKDTRLVVVRIPRTSDPNGMPVDFESLTTRLLTEWKSIDDDGVYKRPGLNLKYYNRAIVYGSATPLERSAQIASGKAMSIGRRPMLPEGLYKALVDARVRRERLVKEGADELAILEAHNAAARLFNEVFFKHEWDWSAILNCGTTWESTLLCFLKGDDDKEIERELGILETTQEGLATMPMENVWKGHPQNTPQSSSNALAPAVEEELPEFPRLSGPLGRVVDAITPDIPYEHKALAVLTYVGLKLSGRVRFAPPYGHLQPRFYACLIGPFGSGKSAAQQEVSRALSKLGEVHVEFSIDSGPALVEALEEHSHLVYMPDELSDALQKARQGKVLGQLLRLYEGNEAGRRVVSKNGGSTKLTDAHLAIVASATPEGFRDVWQGGRGRASGLQSRFVISFSEKRMPTVKTPNNEKGLECALCELADVLHYDDTKVISMDPDPPYNSIDLTYFGFPGALADALGFSRVVDMGRRFALIMAACNGLSEINEDIGELASAFIYYQIKAYERLMPDDASNPVQALENRIIRFFQKHERATQREVRNYIKPEYSPGGHEAYNRAFVSLTRAGKLKQDASNRVGKEIWKLDD